ncbi:hypothetical protein ACN4EK_03580 [Pantanalinema rosaneae CENA516]|uniref:hypothetical protein n=1 Tax=Pantanalinema rosaneae TaxID=1620701 RepID=UPI003D6FD1BF
MNQFPELPLQAAKGNRIGGTEIEMTIKAHSPGQKTPDYLKYDDRRRHNLDRSTSPIAFQPESEQQILVGTQIYKMLKFTLLGKRHLI